MKKELKEKADLFLQNRKAIKDKFRFENESNYLMSSFLYTDQKKEVDIDKLESSHKILRDKTRFLSDYRYLELLLSTKMSLSNNPYDYFVKLDNINKNINGKRIFSSIYNIISSLVLCECTNDKNLDSVIENQNNIYNAMKKNHPFLTDVSDVPFIYLLSLSNKKYDELVNEIEECYKVLTDYFKSYKDQCLSMAQILALSTESVDKKTKRVIEIYELLTKNKKKFDKSFGLTILATLVFIEGKSNDIVNDIIEVDNYLGCQKGSGLWPYGKSTRLLFAMLITESIYGKKEKSDAKNIALISSIITENIMIMLLVMNMIILTD